MDYFLFLIVSLAIWRITHLLAKEDGPWDLIYRLRKTVGAGFLGNLLDCFYCLSIWIALPFGLWLGITWWEKFYIGLLFQASYVYLNKQQPAKKIVHLNIVKTKKTMLCVIVEIKEQN